MARVDLFVCGDVMTGRGVDQILPHPSSPELYEPYLDDARDYVRLAEEVNGPIPRGAPFAYVWGDARDELRRRSPSARIVNLETSVTTSAEPRLDKGIHYRMNPLNVPCLTAAEIDVCSLANNHVLDWGENGLRETLDTLHGAGILTAGAGRSAAEAEAIATIEVTRESRVLVLGVAHASSGVSSSWAASGDEPGVALLRDLGIEEAGVIGRRLAQAKRPGDVSVVSIHWGSNWGYEVPDAHVRFAHALVEHGVDVIHGHSSHHPRPLEIYRGKPIFYGCGDFLTDYEGIGDHEPYRHDLVLMYFPSFDGGRLVDLAMVPMRLRRMRLERASHTEAAELASLLTKVSAPYGTKLELGEGGDVLRVGGAS